MFRLRRTRTLSLAACALVLAVLPGCLARALWQPTDGERVYRTSRGRVAAMKMGTMGVYVTPQRESRELCGCRELTVYVAPEDIERPGLTHRPERWRARMETWEGFPFEKEQKLSIVLTRHLQHVEARVTGPLSTQESAYIACRRAWLEQLRTDGQLTPAREAAWRKELAALPRREFTGPAVISASRYRGPAPEETYPNITVVCRDYHVRWDPLRTLGRIVLTPLACAADVVVDPIMFVVLAWNMPKTL